MRRILLAGLGVISPCGCTGSDFKSSNAPGSGSGGGSGSEDAGEGGRWSSSGGSGSGGASMGGAGASAGGSGGAAPGAGGTSPASGGSTSGTGGAAVVTPEAGPTRWCAGQHALFCEDFDGATQVDALLNSWTNFSLIGGKFSLDQGSTVPSPPNALIVETTADKDVRTLLLQEVAPFAAPPARMLLEFSLQIDTADQVAVATGAAFAAIVTGTQVTDGAIALAVGPGPVLSATYLPPQGGGLGGGADASGQFPQEGVWSGRYALEIVFTGTGAARTGCAQILAGGQPLLAQCLDLPASLVSPAAVSVAIGVYSGGLFTTGPVKLHFDNLIFAVD